MDELSAFMDRVEDEAYLDDEEWATEIEDDEDALDDGDLAD